jgi:hypothetical protein
VPTATENLASRTVVMCLGPAPLLMVWYRREKWTFLDYFVAPRSAPLRRHQPRLDAGIRRRGATHGLGPTGSGHDV